MKSFMGSFIVTLMVSIGCIYVVDDDAGGLYNG